MNIVYRPAEPADRSFLIGTFLDSYREAHAAGLLPMDQWHAVMGPVWSAILDRPGVDAHVAAWEGEDDGIADLVGWLAVERGYLVSQKVRRFRRWCRRLVVATEPLVLYCYVAQAYRGAGHARRLFRAAGVDPLLPFRAATKTPVVSELEAAGKISRVRFDPLVVRYPKHEDDDHGQDRSSRAAAG